MKLQWLEPKDHEQIDKEMKFLKRCDYKAKIWKDRQLLKFRVEVLGKYQNHQYCALNISDFYDCRLGFMDEFNERVESLVIFWIEKRMVVMQADQFVEVPPKERNYWYKHQILDNFLIQN
jgi:hypothetical protein